MAGWTGSSCHSSISPSGTAIDIGHALDASPWSPFQRKVLLLAALAIIFDGFDGQLIGFAIPVLIKEWGVTRGDFAPVVAAGLVGMAIGSAGAGLLADRIGRRTSLLLSVLIFALGTAAIGFAHNLLTIGILRFVAGLGVGGALPSATTLSAEYTPARLRTIAVTATIVCVPAGGMVAGLFAATVLPDFGWRVMFLAGGAVPLLLLGALARGLPESPRWLAGHPMRWPELAALLRRMGQNAPADSAFVDPDEQRRERGEGFSALFRQGRAPTTIFLWIAFFLCLMSVYTAFSWLPAMLAAQGLSITIAGSGLTAYNLGGVLGALICAAAISRFGSRWPLILCCAGAAVSAYLLRSIDGNQNTALLIFGLGVHGLFVNAVQSTMYALSAYIYPTNIRATGTAGALSFGRLGTILSAFVGAAVLTAGGADALLLALALAMTGTLVALALLRHHIPPQKPQEAV